MFFDESRTFLTGTATAPGSTFSAEGHGDHGVAVLADAFGPHRGFTVSSEVLRKLGAAVGGYTLRHAL